MAKMSLGELFVRLSADTKEFTSAMQGVGKTLDGAGKKMVGIGTTMSKSITLPLVGLATAAIATVMKFDDSMAKVSAITGATGDDLDDLREVAKRMGAETRFSAVEAAEGMTFLGMAGFETHEIIDAMPAVLNLAAAGALDLARASDIASDIMSGFGIEASDMGRVADVLAMTASRANTSVEMMGETMKFAAPIAREFGVSLEETSAMAGLMADAGIKGSQAGTTLRTVFTRLAAPSAEAASLMKQLGIETMDANGDMLSMGEILRSTEGAMEGMSESQRLQTAETLFGRQAMTGMLAVLGEGADTFDEFVDQLENSEGAAADMAKTMEDTLGGAFRELKSATEGLLIEFGEVMVPVFRRIAELVADVARGFAGLDDRTKKIIVVAGAFLAALGPLLIILGKLSIAVGALIGFIAGLSAPVIIVIAVIAGLVAGFIHLWETNEEFRERVLAIWENVKKAFTDFANTIKDNIGGFTDTIKRVAMPIIAQFGDSFLKFIDGVMPAWESFKNAIDGLMPIIKLVGTVVGAVLGVMLAVFVGTINAIIQGLNPLIQALTGFVAFFTNIVSAIGKLLKGDFDGFWRHFKAAFKGAWDFVTGILNTAIGVVTGFVSGFISVIKGLVSAVVGNSLIPDMVNSVLNWLKKLPTQAVGIIRDLVRNILNGLSGLPAQMLAIGKNIVNSIWRGISQMGATLARNVANFVARNVPAPIRKLLGIGSPSKLFEDFGRGIGSGLVKGVEGSERMVERARDSLMDSVMPDKDMNDFGVNGMGEVRGMQRREIIVELVGAPANIDNGTFKDMLRGILRDPEMMRDLDNIGFENFTTRVRPRGGF